MTNTGLDSFDKTVQETNLLLKDIEETFGLEGHRDISYNLLRGVVHTLRDRLTVEEASDFAASLPLLVKGIFYDGWNPAKMPVKMDRNQFFAHFRERFPMDTEQSDKELVQGVLLCLRKYVSNGEMEELQDVLPEKISQLLSA